MNLLANGLNGSQIGAIVVFIVIVAVLVGVGLFFAMREQKRVRQKRTLSARCIVRNLVISCGAVAFPPDREHKTDSRLPEDYIGFLSVSDGLSFPDGESILGRSGATEVEAVKGGYIVFATDGKGGYYAFSSKEAGVTFFSEEFPEGLPSYSTFTEYLNALFERRTTPEI